MFLSPAPRCQSCPTLSREEGGEEKGKGSTSDCRTRSMGLSWPATLPLSDPARSTKLIVDTFTGRRSVDDPSSEKFSSAHPRIPVTPEAQPHEHLPVALPFDVEEGGCLGSINPTRHPLLLPASLALSPDLRDRLLPWTAVGHHDFPDELSREAGRVYMLGNVESRVRAAW